MENLDAEIQKLIEENKSFIERNYLQIRTQYLNSYNLPELDPIRYEICKCLFVGCYQAAITLSNHLLENSLKTFLIYHDLINKKTSSVELFYGEMKISSNKFNDKNLNETIDMIFNCGLIDDNQKIKLHEFRNNYRNAFSHADKKKTFGSEKTGFTTVGLKNGEIIVKGTHETNKAEMLITQGIFQAIKAENESISYFTYIDSIVRHVINKLDELKKTKT